MSLLDQEAGPIETVVLVVGALRSWMLSVLCTAENRLEIPRWLRPVRERERERGVWPNTRSE